MIGRMKEWEGRIPSGSVDRAFTADDDARLWPLAEAREACLIERRMCFVCDADRGQDDQRQAVDPVIASVERGLMIRIPVCSDHAKFASWSPGDYELARWMMENGWGKPMDPAMLGDPQ